MPDSGVLGPDPTSRRAGEEEQKKLGRSLVGGELGLAAGWHKTGQNGWEVVPEPRNTSHNSAPGF